MASSAPDSGLRGIDALFAAAWEVFQRRFGTLFAIYLLMLVAAVGPPLLGAGIGVLLSSVLPFGKGGIVGVCALVGGIGAFAGLSCGFGALVVAVLEEDLGVREAFARSWEKFLSFAWVSFLVGFVVSGGFLLLIIPGIIFSVWFFFAHFVIFDDDTRGMPALLKSRAYVSGRWFDVFLRLMLIWACSAAVGTVPLVGPLLTLVTVPFVMVYQALLFRDLKEAAGPVAYGCSTGDTAKVVGVAVLGYVAIPAVILGFFGSLLMKQLPLISGIPATIALPGEPRVIPIPPMPGAEPSSPAEPSVAPATPGAAPAGEPAAEPTGSAIPSSPAQARAPEHLHVFIYAVNCPGSVSANGVEIQKIEDKPDMQYNYNLNGEKLRHGRNSITVDYAPMKVGGSYLEPKIKIRISSWKDKDKRVLGEWTIQETSPGQKSFDLDVPEGI